MNLLVRRHGRVVVPEPAEPFRDLTLAIWRRFPQAPPYRGAHGDAVTPHLTIGHGGPLDAMQAAAVQINTQLPKRAMVTEVRLIIGKAEQDSWRTDETFPLLRQPDVHRE